MCRCRPEEDQSIWSKHRQGFQPCCEAGIGEPTLSEGSDVLYFDLEYCLTPCKRAGVAAVEAMECGGP